MNPTQHFFTHILSGTRSLYVFVQPYQLLEGMMFFIALISIILVFILFYLAKRSRRSARRKALREQFSEVISEIAVCDSQEEVAALLNEPSIMNILDPSLKDPFSRKVLIKELLLTARSMSGMARENVCWIYGNFSLDQDSLLRLKTGKWHTKARAIQELSQLKQNKHITKIYRYTNDRNDLVRNEARVGVIKLTGFDGLRFLDVISYPITEWEQLSLLHELLHRPGLKPLELKRWLTSGNTSVVEFALRLTETFRVHELHDEVLACLKSPYLSARLKALQALKEIHGGETANEIITALVKEENPVVQRAMLECLGHIGSEVQIDRLVPFLSNSPQEVKMAAATCISNLDPQGFAGVAAHVDENSFPWNVLLKQLRKEVSL